MLANTLIVLGLAAVGTSFTIPGGQANGLYKAYYNAAGEEVHELVSTDSLDNTSPLPGVAKRHEINERWNSQETWCGCAFPMNAGDTNVANQRIANYAAGSPTLPAYTSQYAVQNSAVAFICNSSGSGAGIASNIVSNTSPDISYACGNFIAGTARIDGFSDLDYGYMNYFSGLNFCGAAESSTEKFCSGSTGGGCCQCWTDCHDNCANGFSLNPIGEAACYAVCTNGCCSCPV